MINKTITMTITQIEKSPDEFKKTHKIKVSGPYDDEEMPKWFKIYAEKTDARLQKLEELPKWFKEYAEKTDARLKRLEELAIEFKEYAKKTDTRLKRLEELAIEFKEYAKKTDARLKRLEEETPKWFKTWVETDYKPFKEFVMKQFEDHGWIKK